MSPATTTLRAASRTRAARGAASHAGPAETDTSGAGAAFEAHRPVLLGAAYRILGSLDDAEDVVQEAWLRWSEVDHTRVEAPRRFLVKVASRLAIDRLRLAHGGARPTSAHGCRNR
ncbi:sigma factor [Amycolatopsis sp. NPDC050768]|uniref:sigma factor n=1 Tax=Amycolatopsis sp. NPDC050768 TaxID=3154839 RepID=UPI0033F142DD